MYAMHLTLVSSIHSTITKIISFKKMEKVIKVINVINVCKWYSLYFKNGQLYSIVKLMWHVCIVPDLLRKSLIQKRNVGPLRTILSIYNNLLPRIKILFLSFWRKISSRMPSPKCTVWLREKVSEETNFEVYRFQMQNSGWIREYSAYPDWQYFV